jgi:cell division septation protein DedD
MAFNGDVAGVSQLIISGADIDARLHTGGTPLHLAAYNGHTAVVRLLVEHGARVNARTKAGIRPLDWAQRNGHDDIAKLLKAYGGRQGKPSRARLSGPDGAAGPGDKRDTAPTTARRVAPKKFSLMGLEDSGVEADKVPDTDRARVEKPVSSGGYRIQLGAFGTKKRATEAWSIYRKRFPELLGSRALLLDQVVVNGKTLQRVQIGPMNRNDAWGICAELKRAGQSCAVMKRGPS